MEAVGEDGVGRRGRGGRRAGALRHLLFFSGDPERIRGPDRVVGGFQPRRERRIRLLRRCALLQAHHRVGVLSPDRHAVLLPRPLAPEEREGVAHDPGTLYGVDDDHVVPRPDPPHGAELVDPIRPERRLGPVDPHVPEELARLVSGVLDHGVGPDPGSVPASEDDGAADVDDPVSLSRHDAADVCVVQEVAPVRRQPHLGTGRSDARSRQGEEDQQGSRRGGGDGGSGPERHGDVRIHTPRCGRSR